MVNRLGMRLSQGFTLLELLVALAVFAVLAGIAYGSLETVLHAREETELRNRRRAEIMFAMTLLERDLMQIVPRPVRNEFDQVSAAVIVERAPGARIEFTRTGLPNPRSEKRSALQRVAYELGDGRLVRRIWLVLDRTSQTVPVEEVLLEDVEGIAFEVLAENWTDTWPADLQPSEKDLVAMPRAVRITLTLGDLGDLVRIVPGTGE